ncbi:MAG TPA: polysaccharide biosynthesis/export family protein [Flavitalea sp.]|nr:polysaccharide biosynthesis/export family protein [Flavitalea sp.]
MRLYSALFCLLLIMMNVLPSCTTTKKVAYLGNIGDTSLSIVMQDLEPVIQKNDLLSILVTSVNQEVTQVFNIPNNNAIGGANSSGTNTGTINQAVGYLVNQSGYIQFPLLGHIQAAGLTKKELTESITNSLVSKKLLLDPTVTIRYLNYRITVLGEVSKPSVINVPNERISILEALGLAGDITIYGQKNNVLLIRETEGRKVSRRIDLNSSDLVRSPYYYLQSNDVLYVEPNKAKVSSSGSVRQWLPIVVSVLTLGVVTVDRLIK